MNTIDKPSRPCGYRIRLELRAIEARKRIILGVVFMYCHVKEL
jgi:hypothetical protein